MSGIDAPCTNVPMLCFLLRFLLSCILSFAPKNIFKWYCHFFDRFDDLKISWVRNYVQAYMLGAWLLVHTRPRLERVTVDTLHAHAFVLLSNFVEAIRLTFCHKARSYVRAVQYTHIFIQIAVISTKRYIRWTCSRDTNV